MFGRVIVPEYLDQDNQVVDVNINKKIVQNTLIDLEVAINIMTSNIMFKFDLQYSLRKTTIVL